MGNKTKLAGATLAAFVAIAGSARAQDTSDIQDRLSEANAAFNAAEPEFSFADVAATPGAERMWQMPGLIGLARYAYVTEAPDMVASGHRQCDNTTAPRETRAYTGSLGANYTSNALLSPGGGGDTALQPSLGFTWTRRALRGHCASKFQPDWLLTFKAGAAAEDYLADIADDSSSLTTSVQYTQRIGRALTTTEKFRTRWTVSVTSLGAFGDLYEDWQSTSHDARLALSHTFFETNERGGASIVLRAGHNYSTPDSGEYDYGTVVVSRTLPNMFGWRDWNGTLEAWASHRSYEASPREDWIYNASLGLTRDLGNGVELATGLSVRVRDSNTDARDYEAVSFPLTLTLTRKSPP